MPTRLLANPASGRGRGATALPSARQALAAAGINADVRSTSAAGDEERLAREAVADGIDTLIVLGGDGTWSQAVRGVIEAGGGATCRIAFLAAGTGNDLVKSISAPAADFAATSRLIAAGAERRMDAARVNGRVFINSAGFGFDAAVLERTLRPSALRGSAVYIKAALAELFGYPGLAVRVEGEGERRRLLLVFANGRWFGGAFHIAPTAMPDDGALDMIGVDDAGPFTRLRLFAAVMGGKHLSLDAVEHRRAANFTLSFPSPPNAQVDGELVRLTEREVTLTCLPGALRVVAP